MKFFIKWYRHLVLILLLLILPIVAIYFNGKNAWDGITWGIGSGQKLLPVINIHELNVNYGVYDHDKKFTRAKGLAFEHFFYQWNRYYSNEFLNDLNEASEKNRWPLVTIEPYPWTNDSDTAKNLFKDIINGHYDQPISQLAEDIKVFNKPVFIRWGHEMEKVSGRYPWATMDYEGYILAYRYVVDKLRESVKEVFFVWSPVGNKEMFDYWPGSRHVDFVGISVYAFHEFDLDHYGKLRSFKEIFDEKYDRAKVFDKSIMIAEMGIAGEKAYQLSWMYDAFKNFENYPQLKSLIYFNAKDSKLAWDEKYSIPDWHIDSTLFDQYDFTVPE